MKWFEIFCTVAFTLMYCGFVKSDMVVACRVEDLPCLNLSTRLFLNATATGIPDYGLLAIDPISIPDLELRPDDKSIDLVYTMTNIVLTGLRDEDVTDFKIDRKTFNARLQVLAPNLIVEGNMKIALASNRSYSVSGKYSGKGAVSLTVSYHCPIQMFPDGTEHFVVGPETSECDIVGEPSYKLDVKFVQELEKAKEIQQERAKLQDTNIVNILRSALCKVAKIAYVSVIHNTRTVAKILPKSSFMTDI